MGLTNNNTRCVLVLGGSFDPIHLGHVALASCLTRRLQPDELRLIPAGQPWQKSALTATSEQRVSMLKLAFEDWKDCPITIDEQEIQRAEQQQSSYTIDTLKQLRAECGADTSIIFAMGADQLQNLHTWHQWRDLFELANLCVAARPGYSLKIVSQEVAKEWHERLTSAEDMRHQPNGTTMIEPALAVDVSATQLRTELKQHNPTMRLLVPHKVLDYIQQHSIY